MAKIKKLQDFEERKAFILLDERASEIEKIIEQIQVLRKLECDAIQAASQSQSAAEKLSAKLKPELDYRFLILSLTKLAFLHYRSMFQSAYWEDNSPIKSEIIPIAYSYDDKHEELHKEIVEYTHQVLAHQDIAHCFKKRGVDWSGSDKYGNNYSVVSNLIPYHADALIPLISLMKNAIRTAYSEKFEEPLPHPLIMRGL